MQTDFGTKRVKTIVDNDDFEQRKSMPTARLASQVSQAWPRPRKRFPKGRFYGDLAKGAASQTPFRGYAEGH